MVFFVTAFLWQGGICGIRRCESQMRIAQQNAPEDQQQAETDNQQGGSNSEEIESVGCQISHRLFDDLGANGLGVIEKGQIQTPIH